MWLQKQRCGCRNKKVSEGANMCLQEPIYDFRSQDVAAGAKMWLQEKLGLLEPLCLGLFLLEANFHFSDPCLHLPSFHIRPCNF